MFDRILVVCVGNICRSPTAERLLQRGLPHKSIQSAGLHAMVDHPADDTTRQVAESHGLSLEGHRARQLTQALCQQAELILVMEKRHISAVNHIDASARGKTMLMGHWSGQAEVSDPYRMSIEAHEHVYQLLEKTAQTWIEKLR